MLGKTGYTTSRYTEAYYVTATKPGMNLTTVLLDAGGVLLDEAEMEASRAAATARFLTEQGHEYTQDRYWADIEEAVHAFCADTYLYVFRKYGAEYEAFQEGCARAGLRCA